MAIEENKPIVKSWRIYFDGAVNALGHDIGVILISLDGYYYPITIREKNQIANALATIAAVIKIYANTEIQPIKLDVKDVPTHCSGVEEKLMGGHDIFYKRNRDQVLLKCVNTTEVKRIIEEVHDEVCEAYANGHMMTR
ncbi:uncharacterized protein LOC111274212 [Durio zibethinus]|uniref:Uncharacterized protein LOC111274212 n=1 Tax=Durio zibethinus TaxID=66656 RepID=A0A6P5WFC5_DURZI|nr:uncharacterized protein LOC111274212 [Durio zibethinus]